MTYWTEHSDNAHSDIGFAWKRFDEGGRGPEVAIEAGLLMLQSVARSLAVLADEAEERRNK